MKAEPARVMGGSPPYGYRVRHHRLVHDPVEWSALGLMVRLRKQGLSFRQIVSELDDAGYAPKRGTWTATTVRRILAREHQP